MTVDEMTPEQLALRHLPLPGTHNVRDVGGYPTRDGRVTRWGTLLRADALHKLDESGRDTLSGLGVRTLIDLREIDELDRSPNQLGALEVRILHRPMFDRPTSGIPATAVAARTLQETYFLLVDERATALVGVVRELAGQNALPAIVHCTAGKDRTGMVIALTLAAVGVEDEAIISDYAATGQLLSGAFRQEMLARTAERGIDIAAIEPLLSADPKLIRGFLERIRERYGDIEAFLFAHGMTGEELQSLREQLLTTDEQGGRVA